MDQTIVDALHDEFSHLIDLLDRCEEISLRSSTDGNFRKFLLLCAASYFERCLTDGLLNYIRERSNDCPIIIEFVKNKAISRQYHSWFDWDARNANRFFSLFGDDFKRYITTRIKDDAGIVNSIKSFMELGAERNRLVHTDFGSFSLEKTSEEIYDLYKKALKFVESFPTLLHDFNYREP